MRNIERYHEQIKEVFKELSTPEVYDTWCETFNIEEATKSQVVITYHGDEDLKIFEKNCRENLVLSVFSVMGEVRKIKILKKKNSSKTFSSKAKKNIHAVKFFIFGMIFVGIAAAIILVLCNYIGNRNFRETFYNTSSIKVDGHVRVIQLSDLHGTSFGKNNDKLIKRIKALEPDIIICTGDMVDSAKKDVDFVADLGKKISEIAPSYYIYGNNEVETIYDFALNEKELDKKFGFDKTNRDETALLKIEDSFEETLEKSGINVLKNEKDTIKIKNITVDVYGVLNSNPSSFWSYSGKAFADYIYEDTDNLKITAIHEPFIFEELNHDYWGDLLVCGHTHGGLMRVPVLGPLFTNEGGLLPERSGKFVYGRYDAEGSPLIVSAGLENSNPLRINNEPELVVIDINKF